MVMVCFSEIIERKQRYRASPNIYLRVTSQAKYVQTEIFLMNKES
jgi:hypothetical protein